MAAEPPQATDRFVAERLPPPALCPEFIFELPELQYPARLNCAVTLVDDALAEGQGERPCVIGPAENWTYRALAERVNQIANVLRGHGVGPGNRVLLRAPNNPMALACWLAIQKIGAVAVATMPLLRARELSVILNKAQVSLALCDVRLRAELEAAAATAPRLEATLYFAPDGTGNLDAEVQAAATECIAAETSAEDVSLIAFTSGTTGMPKGCVHAHRDVLAVADTFSRHILKPNANDVFCGSPPLAFTFGLGGAVIFPLRARATTVMTEVSSPAALAQTIERYRVTVCFTAPTAYRAMLGHEVQSDLSSLRRCVSAGEALPRETWEAFKSTTGIDLIDGIGSTEMMHIFISCADGDIKPGATGKAVPGFRAVIQDEAGNELPRGSTGRLAVKGPCGCRYLDDARQSEYVQDGWNITGDTYHLDTEGYFWFAGRSDDMIVSAGYNISPSEVEGVLLEHPAVRECAAVASPDAERGFVVKAFIVAEPDYAGDATLATTLQDFVKARIAPYKYPRAIAFVESLPRTESGKIQRFRLRTEPQTPSVTATQRSRS